MNLNSNCCYNLKHYRNGIMSFTASEDGEAWLQKYDHAVNNENLVKRWSNFICVNANIEIGLFFFAFDFI